MPEADILAAFPRRPLAVRAGWRSTLGNLAGAAGVLACLGGAAYFTWSEGRELLQEARIWDTGRPVPALGWRWHCRTQLVLSQCDVDVSYEARPGRTVTLPATALVFMGMDETPPPLQVKVDPENPERFAASILVNERPSRWLALGLLSGGLLVLAGIIGGGVWALLRQECAGPSAPPRCCRAARDTPGQHSRLGTRVPLPLHVGWCDTHWPAAAARAEGEPRRAAGTVAVRGAYPARSWRIPAARPCRAARRAAGPCQPHAAGADRCGKGADHRRATGRCSTTRGRSNSRCPMTGATSSG